MRYTRLGTLVVLGSSLLVATGQADDAPPDESEPPRIAIGLFESAIALAIPSAYYWATREEDDTDFDLAWDWPSWKAKLTLDAVRFDTNSFHVNAVRHPLMSTINYHIGRSNHFGMLGSTILASVQGVIWEFFVEYRENPSLNDLIINSVTGLQIGEPLWQIGQLWRGGVLTAEDRVKTTLFSPLDGAHDLAGLRHRWWRPRAWRSIAFQAGGAWRSEDEHTQNEAVFVGDIDVVNDWRYVSSEPQRGAIKPGSWSRIRGRLAIGDAGSGTEVVGTQLQSRTAIAGVYRQDGAGNGVFTGVGTAFTYRRDRLPDTWDHVAIAHIIGPQFQLSRRTGSLALRWDIAAYGNFAFIDPQLFGSTTFLEPPPYVSALQANGYYDGAGVTGTSRIRFDSGPWNVDAEIDGHQIWQIDGADRLQSDELRTTVPVTAYDISDVRVYWRAQLGYRFGQVGIATNLEGTHRHSAWRSVERQSSNFAFGLVGVLDL